MFAPSPPELVGESAAWLETLEHVSLVAPLDRPLLVVGERGTGKELVAERVHFLSKRWEGPYIKVNCAALSKDLLDSELFGHEAGAFTGATKRRAGRFEQADGGTLFLDEIATASLEVQEKLLRVIEYGEFQRLGGEQIIPCDVRVIAATNVDLPARAADGRFRADLMDRLAFDVVTMAPLRLRGNDAILLAEHFGRRMARETGRDFPGFSPGAHALFLNHTWPGNVRELKNVAERVVYKSLAARSPMDEDALVDMDIDQLDPFDSPWRPGKDLSLRSSGSDSVRGVTQPELGEPLESRLSAQKDERAAPVDFLRQTLAFERLLLEDALNACGYHQRKTATHLGISYNQLRGLLRKHKPVQAQEAEDKNESDPEVVKPVKPIAGM